MRGYLLVLSGTIGFHSESYEPINLNVGDNVYYDSGMGISVGPEDTHILWACTPSEWLMAKMT